MTEHYCCRDITVKGMVSYHGWKELPPQACGKIAHFCVPSNFPYDGKYNWYCAECWDFVIEWNRFQHENWGTPLIQP